MKAAGAVLLALAGLWCGLRSAGELRGEERELGELCRMLSRLSYELERFRTPLPELFSALGEELSGGAGSLCRRAAAGLAAGRELPSLWQESVKALPAPAGEILAGLGPVLGRYGGQEQLDALSAARTAMDSLREERRAALTARCRVRFGLWSAAGVLAAVLFY